MSELTFYETLIHLRFVVSVVYTSGGLSSISRLILCSHISYVMFLTYISYYSYILNTYSVLTPLSSGRCVQAHRYKYAWWRPSLVGCSFWWLVVTLHPFRVAVQKSIDTEVYVAVIFWNDGALSQPSGIYINFGTLGGLQTCVWMYVRIGYYLV